MYKVWIQIEEVDEDNDHYENMTEPMCVGKFDDVMDASKLLQKLIDTSYDWNEEFISTIFNRMAPVLDLDIEGPNSQVVRPQNKG